MNIHTSRQLCSFPFLALNSAKSANPQLAAIFSGKAAAQAAVAAEVEASMIRK